MFFSFGNATARAIHALEQPVDADFTDSKAKPDAEHGQGARTELFAGERCDSTSGGEKTGGQTAPPKSSKER